MKPLLILCSALAVLALAACGEQRPSHAETRASHQSTANEADKSFDKENPANPDAMQVPAPTP